MRKFSDIINDLAYRHSVSNIFSDYLELSICALSFQKKEERYIEIATRYSATEISKFSEAFAAMILEMGDLNNGWRDPLGDFFTEFVTRGHNGQFFTPTPVTELMAIMTIEGRSTGQRVADIACGSGRTLLSAAKAMGPDNSYYGADIDRNCAMMSAINLILNGLPGEVAWMNSLSNQFFGGWALVTFPFPHLIEINEELSYIVLNLPKAINTAPDPVFIHSLPASNPTQLLLFE